MSQPLVSECLIFFIIRQDVQVGKGLEARLFRKKFPPRRIVHARVLGSVKVSMNFTTGDKPGMQDKGRKHLKTMVLVTLIVGLMGATSAYAFRMGGGCGMGGGKGMRWMMNLTPEQAGQVFDLKQKFMNDTAELRKGMLVKGAELAQLWKAETPDDKAILAKVKELGALRAQFMEKAVAQRLAMKKLVPAAGMGHCPTMGPGGGHGPMGPGSMGPGVCPPGGVCPAPGPGQGKGPEKGASLAPGSDDMAGFEGDFDQEMAAVQDTAW
jgi:Spy/CpxP family protein refolding chaperone